MDITSISNLPVHFHIFFVGYITLDYRIYRTFINIFNINFVVNFVYNLFASWTKSQFVTSRYNSFIKILVNQTFFYMKQLLRLSHLLPFVKNIIFFKTRKTIKLMLVQTNNFTIFLLQRFSQILKHKQRARAGDVDIHLHTKHMNCWFIKMIMEKVCDQFKKKYEKWKENLCRLEHIDSLHISEVIMAKQRYK